ncbi:hypothetical protein Q9295_06180 [Xinfangfangia sp. CPCC 101601]|uniref:Lipoprotein n=1 Tax=Pseudogemmobacter lacusdianii TaxID=3069608 RepID=A0ABU0VW17_9RHOB|nr:hypothetical protein [Xinfangfangia sp. CPCC 101601]MDQ2065951.1 hypothetical protein [Xinfangfangia sp. CPCC 101601]
MKRLLPLSFLALLTACGTPQEQCIARNTRDLRTVEQLIAETQGNLQRGYALEKRVERYRAFEPCLLPSPPDANGNPQPPRRATCPDVRERTYTVPKTIDLQLESRKLAQLQDKRLELQRSAQQVVQQCKAQYPE